MLDEYRFYFPSLIQRYFIAIHNAASCFSPTSAKEQNYRGRVARRAEILAAD
jgi:hypothetical protein